MSRIEVTAQGTFLPHRLLIGAASHHLESAKDKKPGYFYECLSSILFSALATEAIGNTYGEALIPRWEDFESARPIAKLRLIAMSCGMTVEIEKHPWVTAQELIKFRNLVAHPRPKPVSSKTEATHQDYQKFLYIKPESPLEKMVTQEFAEKGHDAVAKILEIFSEKIAPAKLVELEVQGWAAQASVIADGPKRE